MRVSQLVLCFKRRNKNWYCNRYRHANRPCYSKIERMFLLVLESNHDLDLLKKLLIWILKQQSSRQGHLSNIEAAQLIVIALHEIKSCNFNASELRM